MNADHVSSLSLYLQHYAQLSPSASSSPKLVDISYTHLTILDNTGTEHEIPIEPPLRTWSDVRMRLKTMDEDSRQALGLSSSSSSSGPSSSPIPSTSKPKDEPRIIIDKWTAPHTPFQLLVVALMTYFFTSQALLRLGFLSRGTFIYEHILVHYPGGADRVLAWNWSLVPALVMGVHVVEVLVLDLYILRAAEGKYGISRGQKLWWKWVLSTSVEGMGSIFRIRGLVEERRRELEKVGKKL
jgi:Protein of unknown function (DUF2470)